MTYYVGAVQEPIVGDKQLNAVLNVDGGRLRGDSKIFKLEDHIDDLISKFAPVASSGLQRLQRGLRL